jgi:hypothetical protein
MSFFGARVILDRAGIVNDVSDPIAEARGLSSG